MKTTDVRFWEVRRRKTATASWEVRWIVAGKHCSRSRRTKGLADAFLADLRAAARRGESFDTDSGLPDSMQPATQGPTWLEFVQQYLDVKWPHAAAKSRDSMTDALATVTAALIRANTEPLDPYVLRDALRNHLLPPAARVLPAHGEVADAVDWLTTNSIHLRELEKARQLRRGLDAVALTLDGSPAAATTVRRKRAVFNNALQYAVEIEELPANNLGRVGWRAAAVSDVVDRRVVINPRQASELLTAVTYVGPVDRGLHLRAFFACLYYAGLRPSEAQALRLTDCELPDKGWGHLNLTESSPWTWCNG